MKTVANIQFFIEFSSPFHIKIIYMSLYCQTAENRDVKCIMCMYFMQIISMDVGFPMRDVSSDNKYPKFAQNTPVGYLSDLGGADASLLSPFPAGPGYNFLENSEHVSLRGGDDSDIKSDDIRVLIFYTLASM